MYRIATGEEVRCARSDKEDYEVERLGNIVHEYFPELNSGKLFSRIVRKVFLHSGALYSGWIYFQFFH